MMLVVGLTGGIGSGKSTVARIFDRLGISIYDSDSRAKALYSESQELRGLMISNFGLDIYTHSGINREKLAAIVFQDENKLALLNSLVHPLLQKDFESWMCLQSSPYVIREAAILIESGAYKSCDKTIVVTASKEVRIRRVVNRDGVTESQVQQRMKNQLSDSERMQYADFEIQNNGKESLIEQVLMIDKKLKVGS
jgi:dephospho-CoA kinase